MDFVERSCAAGDGAEWIVFATYSTWRRSSCSGNDLRGTPRDEGDGGDELDRKRCKVRIVSSGSHRGAPLQHRAAQALGAHRPAVPRAAQARRIALLFDGEACALVSQARGHSNPAELAVGLLAALAEPQRRDAVRRLAEALRAA